MKVKLEGVQETLLIPLMARALETKKENPKVRDEAAVEMVSRIDYDFSKFENTISMDGIVARTIILDREIKNYCMKYPDTLCITIGCGLDTRCQRMKNEKIKWVNLDFPEVIELRKKLIDPEKEVQTIAKSALDEGWTKEIHGEYEHVLIILEGILMYLKEEEVRKLFGILRDNFRECTAFAEIMHPLMVSQTKHHDTVKNTNAVFQWGIKSGKEIEKLCEGIECVNEWNQTDVMIHMGRKYRIMGSIPFFRNRNDKILEVHIKEK